VAAPIDVKTLTWFVALACCADAGAAPIKAPARSSVNSDYTIFVTNEMSGDLSVIDARTRTLTATVSLGKRPRGLTTSPDGKTLFVALSGSPIGGPGVDESKLPPPDKAADGIGVYDVAAMKILKILRGFSDPERVAASADGARLYVASEDTGTAIIADAADGRVLKSLAVGKEPEGIRLNHSGTFAYVTSEVGNQVSVIDTRRQAVVKQLPVGKRPRDIAFSPNDEWAWISGEADASVSVIDARTHVLAASIAIPGRNARPMGMAASRDGKYIYVTTGRGGSLVKIDAASRTVIDTVAVGDRPWGVALSPDDKLIYTANGPSNDVSVVDAASFEVLTRIPVGNRPWDVAIISPAAP
jgi:YVTN family beta-propeller protein